MNGDVSHFFMVLFRVRPQVEVDESRVYVAVLSISLSHKIPQAALDSLYAPDRAAPNLYLSLVTGA